MPEWIYDWNLWWLNFWNDHPEIFLLSLATAVAAALFVRLKRR